MLCHATTGTGGYDIGAVAPAEVLSMHLTSPLPVVPPRAVRGGIGAAVQETTPYVTMTWSAPFSLLVDFVFIFMGNVRRLIASVLHQTTKKARREYI